MPSYPPAPSATPAVALSIAGLDPSSGAGLTADLLTFAAHGLYGISAATALTVQSTQGVEAVQPVEPEWLTRTLDCLLADLPPAGIKIGMLGSAANVVAVTAWLHQAASSIPNIPIVLDPVLVASSGALLLPPEALGHLPGLLRAVSWLTPNWAELSVLAQLPVASVEQAVAALHQLGELYPQLTLVATGGDCEQPTDLLRLPTGELHQLPGEHVETRSTHGTGCAFSSALLSRLLLGDAPGEAFRQAKVFVTRALQTAPQVGIHPDSGHGPLNLLWPYRR